MIMSGCFDLPLLSAILFRWQDLLLYISDPYIIIPTFPGVFIQFYTKLII